MIDEAPCTQRHMTAQEQLQLHTLVWQQHPSKLVVEQAQGPGLEVCPVVQEAVLQVLGSLVSQAAPPSTLYISRLVKQLIIAAEDQDQELSDQLLELNTALLLRGAAADAAQQREDASWQYRTFYYSSRPSWQELQQLQAQHHTNIIAALAPPGSSCKCDGDGSSEQQQAQLQQQAASHIAWTLPTELQQRLLQRQQALQQLLSGVQLQQEVAAACTLAQCTSGNTGQQPVVPCSSSSCCSASKAPAANGATDEHPTSNGLQLNGCSTSKSSSSREAPFGPEHCRGLITTHSSANMFEGGTGCHMWDAGFLLAEFVLNNGHLFAGKRVLEVGCGPGLVATCLCRSGCSGVLLTDGNPWTLVNCLSNLSMNGHRDGMLLGSWREAAGFVQPGQQDCCEDPGGGHKVLACPLDWDEDVPGLSADVIVGSDICYDPDAVPSLVRLLAQLLDCHAAADTSQQAQPPQQTASHDQQAGSCRAVAVDSSSAQGVEHSNGMTHRQPPPQQQQGDAAGAARVGAGERAYGLAGTQPAAVAASAACSRVAPVAYISTTKRQDSTLQLFLDLCAAAGLAVQEVPKDPAVWAKGWGSSSSSSSSTCCAGGASEGAAVFQQLSALQDGEGRERYVLHRVVKRVGL